MSEQRIDDELFDYKLYRFGSTQQIFRGPMPDLAGKYISFIGGSPTFGRFVETPFSQRVGDGIGMRTANFGTEGAGAGFFLTDPEVLQASSNARICVVEAMPASAISNRMFSVRPRRNARLHGVSELMQGIYPDVDFGRFTHVRAMLRHLADINDNRFRLVVNEMRNAWIARTHSLLATIQARTLLFWFSQRPPEGDCVEPTDPVHYPNFVDRAMIDSVRGAADGYAECVYPLEDDAAKPARPRLEAPSGTPISAAAARPTPGMHAAAAEALTPEILRMLKT